MRRAVRLGLGTAVLLIAFAGGGMAAWLGAGRASHIGGRGPGGWRTEAGIGGAEASMLARATVARTGTWALPNSEVIYFNAERDDAGAPLDPRCTYELASRRELPARWWSIGAYVDYHWVANPADRYTYTSTSVARAADRTYVIRVSRQPQPGNWLPLGMKNGIVTLIARLYQPAPAVAARPEAVPLPAIRKLACA